MIAGTLQIQMIMDLNRLQRDLNRATININNTVNIIERNATRASLALSGMAGRMLLFAGAFAAIRGVKALSDISDEMILLNARLKQATQSQQEFVQAQKESYKIAQQNASGLSEVINLFARINVPIRDLGGGVRETAAVIQSLTSALRVSGATVTETNSVILQFSQALASGKVNGDEFRSLMENAPVFMRAVAMALGKTTNELRIMSAQGEFTSEVIANASIKIRDNMVDMAAALPRTTGQAMQVLANDVKVAINKINTDVNVTGGIVSSIDAFRINLLPVIRDDLTIAFQNMKGWIDQNRDSLAVFGSALSSIGSSVATAFGAVGVVAGDFARLAASSGAIDSIATAFKGLTAAVLAYISVSAGRLVSSIYASIAAKQADFIATQNNLRADAAAALMARQVAAAQVMQAQASLASANSLAARTLAANAIAAAEQRLAAYTLLTANAQRAASTSSLLAARAIGFLGGPLGAVITLLGLAAAAWSLYTSKEMTAEERTKQQTKTIEDQNKALLERKRIISLGGGDEEVGRQIDQTKNALAQARQDLAFLQQAKEGKAKFVPNKGQTLDTAMLDTALSVARLEKSLKSLNTEADKSIVLKAPKSASPFLQKTEEILASADKTGTAIQELTKLYADAMEAESKAAEKGGEAQKEAISNMVAYKAAYEKNVAIIQSKKSDANKKDYDSQKTQIQAVKDAIAQEEILADRISQRLEGEFKVPAAIEEANKARRQAANESDKFKAALLREVAAENQTLASKQAYRQMLEDLIKFENERAEAKQKLVDADVEELAAAADTLEQAQEELENYGKTEAMILDVAAAKAELQAENIALQASGKELTQAQADEISKLRTLAATYRATAAAKAGLESRENIEEMNKETADAVKKAADASKQAWDETLNGIAKGFTDIIMSSGQGFKDLAKQAKQYFLKAFADLVIQPQMKVLVTALLGGGTAQAGGGVGGALGNAAQGLGGLSGMANTFAMSGIGQSLGLSTASVFGANAGLEAAYGAFSEVGIASLTSTGSALAGAAGAIASAAPYLAAAAAVFSYFKSKEGGPKSGGFSRQDFTSAGVSSTSLDPNRLFTPNTADADVIKMVKATGAGFAAQLKALGGTGGAAFGLGFDTDPQGTAQNRISGEAFVNGRQVYLNRDREIGRDNAAIAGELSIETQRMMLAAIKASDLPPEVARIISEGIPDATKASEEEIKAVLGDATFWKAAFVDAPGQIAEVFGQAVSLDQFKAVQQGGETLAKTFDRLRPVFAATNLAAMVLGRDMNSAFGSVGLASSAAREQLVLFAGGVDALSGNLDVYYKEFFTETERIEKGTAELVKQFGELGIAMPESRQEFRKLVDGLDLTAEADRKLFAELMKLAPAFASVTKSSEDLKEAEKERAKETLENFEKVAESIGLGFDNLKANLLTAITESESAEMAGEDFANNVVTGIYNSLTGQMAQDITNIITQGLVNPIVDAVITGTSITDAVSKASIKEMINTATKVAEAYGELFKSDDFKNLVQTIRNSLIPIGASAFNALSFLPPPRSKPLPDSTSGDGSGSNTPEPVELPSIRDWIKDMKNTLLDLMEPSEFMRRVAQIQREFDEGKDRIKEFLIPFEKLGKDTAEYKQAADDASEAERLLTETRLQQFKILEQERQKAINEFLQGIGDSINKAGLTELESALYDIDAAANQQLQTLADLGAYSDENVAAVKLNRDLAAGTARLNNEIEKLTNSFEDLQAVTGLVSRINDSIRELLVDAGQMTGIEAIDEQIKVVKEAITASAATDPQATVESANELIDLTMQRYQLEKAASETLKGNAQAQLNFAKQVRDYLKSLATGDFSPESLQRRMELAQKDFRDTFALAKAGDVDAQGRLQSVTDQALQLTRDYFASSMGYTDFFRETTGGLESLTGTIQTDAEKQLGVLNGMDAKAKQTLDVLIGYRDVAKEYQAQVQAAFNEQTQAVVKQYQVLEALGVSLAGLDETLMNLPADLIAAFTASANGGGMGVKPVGVPLSSIASMAAGGNLSGALSVASGQYSAAQLADYWNANNPVGERVTAGDIEQYARMNGIPGYAEGSVFTGPRIGMIGEAGAEAVVPLDQYVGGTDDLCDEIEDLKKTVSELLARIADSSDLSLRQQAGMHDSQKARDEKLYTAVASINSSSIGPRK